VCPVLCLVDFFILWFGEAALACVRRKMSWREMRVTQQTGRPHERHVGRHGLSKETTVFITIHDVQECFETLDLQVRLVAVPFEIATHPENAPSILRPHECALRNRVLHRLFPMLPGGTDLEDLDALPRDPTSNIELRSDVWWRTTTLHELPKVTPGTPSLKIGQRHGYFR